MKSCVLVKSINILFLFCLKLQKESLLQKTSFETFLIRVSFILVLQTTIKQKLYAFVLQTFQY